MILKTTLDKIYEFINKYNDLLEFSEGLEIAEGEDIHLGIAGYRIQVPSLNISLRDAILLSQDGGEYYESYDPITGEHVIVDEPAPKDAEWEVDSSCVIVCELNEKDLTKYFGWSTNDFIGTVYEYFYPRFTSLEALRDIPCYIDTLDFMDDEEKAREYIKRCEDAYEINNSEDSQ